MMLGEVMVDVSLWCLLKKIVIYDKIHTQNHFLPRIVKLNELN